MMDLDYDSEHEEFHTNRAVLMEELTKYGSSEDSGSEDEPVPFTTTFKPEVFWARLLDGKRRRIRGKQTWYEIVDVMPQKKRRGEDEPPPAKPRFRLRRRVEPARAEPPRADPPRAEPPPAKPLAPRAEPARAEPARAEPPRADPRADPRAELRELIVELEHARAEPPRAEPAHEVLDDSSHDELPELVGVDSSDDEMPADVYSDDEVLLMEAAAVAPRVVAAPAVYISDDEVSDDSDDKDEIKRVRHRASDAHGAKRGLSGHEFRKMARLGLPIFMMNILLFLFGSSQTINSRNLYNIEFFVGVSAIQRAALDLQLASCRYDIIFNQDSNDVNSLVGFLTAVQLCRRLKKGALAHFATVCSTWVWISRSSTKRSVTCPLSEKPTECVKQANKMVGRCTLLMILVMALEGIWILEQPSSSLMCLHPRLKAFKNRIEERSLVARCWWHCHTWMGMYGGESPKATRLWSCSPLVMKLHRKLDRSLDWAPEVTASIAPDGGVTGNRDAMKESQAYPEAYGKAVGQLVSESRRDQNDDGESDTDSDASPTFDADVWSDVDSQEICEALSIPCHVLQ